MKNNTRLYTAILFVTLVISCGTAWAHGDIAEPHSFWDMHKKDLSIALILMLSILAILFYRLRTSARIRKAQERELKTIRRYERMFNGMPIAFSDISVVRNPQGEVVDYSVVKWNAAYESYFYKPDADGPIRRGTIWAEDDPRMKLLLSELTQTLQSGKEMHFQYEDRETGRKYNKVFLPSHNGRHVDAYYMDTTDLNEAQSTIRMMCQKLIVSLRITKMVSWEWRLDKGVIECDGLYDSESPDALSSFSLPVDKFLGKIHPDHYKRITKKFKALINDEFVFFNESFRAYHLSDDLHRHYEWSDTTAVVNTRDSEGRPLSVVGSTLYITKRKELEDQLITAKMQAEESNRLKSAFIANMSHEIRTPLHAIVGFSDLLKDAASEEEREEYIKVIKSNNKLMLKLIDDIIDLSKIEAGALELELSPVDVGLMMQELYQEMLLKVADNSISIAVDEALVRCVVITDRSRVLQVLNNMLSNAMKFTRRGSITMRCEHVDDKLRFSVADTGPGIAEEYHNSIFERFVKVNDFVQGTGLGLPICKIIVEAMGGEIGVVSKLGEGSTFWFTLPYNEAQGLRSL